MNIINYTKTVFRHFEIQALISRGVKVDRHIVVFESDDWGSIRMPSSEARTRLLNNGIKLKAPNTYDRVDTLASDSDLTALMEVLNSVKDKNGNPAIMTLNCVVANPDFKKIKESGFQQYYYEPFTETLNRYPNHRHAFEYWKEGMAKGLFRPQFHGREHLNPMKWMRCLREGDTSAMTGFEEGMFSVLCGDGRSNAFRVLDAYNIDIEGDYQFQQQAITEGLKLFERLFGFRSVTTIAPCYTWDDFTESVFLREGVRYLQGGVFQRHSNLYSQNHHVETKRWMGQKNENNQIYLVRNCSFEPTERAVLDDSRCMREISKQFKMHHPAVVSCHRQNFIGALDAKNRDENLKKFQSLISNIVRQYPDVEFLSSDQLGEHLKNKIQ